MSKIIWHNYQLEGDLGDSHGGDDVCAMVQNVYSRGMRHKISTGVQGRLRAAYNYLSSGKATHISISSDKDCEDDDCDGVGEVVQINLDYLGQQHNIAMSIFSNALKLRGSSYVTVEPTPIADVADEGSRKRIAESSYNSIVGSIVQQAAGTEQDPEVQALITLDVLNKLTGTTDGQKQVAEFISRQREVENAAKNAEANVKGRNAKKMLDDKLAESNFDDAIARSAAHSLWYDYSVIRAPYTENKKTTKLKDGKLSEVISSAWAMGVIHPLNHFYAENTTYNDMGDFEGDVTFFSRADLSRLKSIRGGQESNINHVFKEFGKYGMAPAEGEKEEYPEESTYQYNDRIPVIRLIINLSKEETKKIFIEDKLADDVYTVELWCAGDKLLFKKKNPYYVDYNPYRKNSYQIRDLDELHSGRGIYSIGRSAQELIDNAAIGLFTNLQDLPKLVLEVNKGKLEDSEDFEAQLDTERPIIYTNSIGYRAEFGGNDRAVRVVDIPDNIATFSASLSSGIKMLQELGFNPSAIGQSNISGVRSTGQAVILQENANNNFGRFLIAQQDLVESPIAKYIWIHEGITNKDASILVDSTITVQTYTGFLQKELEAEDTGIFMQNIVGFMQARTQMQQNGNEVGWFDALLGQYVEEKGFDSNNLPIQKDVGVLAGRGQGINQNIGVELDGRNNLPQDRNQVL